MASITLRQVAELANVSLGTASQALNNNPGVAPETRSRVHEAALTLGYKVRLARPAPAESNALAVVGMLTKHDVGEPVRVNDFYFYVQAGIESACRERQISLMYSNIEVDASNRPVAWPAMIRNKHIGGMILIGTFLDTTVDLLQQQLDIPLVLVDSYAPQMSFDSIVTDNIGGATLALNHLTELGHRAIGLIGWNQDSPPSIQERRIGYLNGLHAAGLETPYVVESTLARADGYRAACQLLTERPEVTAIFVGNDLCALGVLDAARDLGRHVPHDLSVVGFDDIDLACESRPTLSTVQVQKTWMGIIGLRRLLERAHEPHAPKNMTVIATKLVVRESTAAPQLP